MSTAVQKGRTLFQVLLDALKKPEPAPKAPAVDLYNPLKLSLGGFVKIATPDYIAYTFSIEMMSEFTRQIAKRTLKFVDYSLFDPDRGQDGTYITLRVIPQDDGKLDCLLLRPKDELPFSKELQKALKGKELVDNESQVKYTMRASHKASIREAKADGSVNRLQVEYWDFINEEEQQPRFYVVEMDLSDREGMIQTYTGSLIAKEDVKPVGSH